MLTGQAKTDYQREYMREWQRNKRGSKQTRSKQVESGSKQTDVRSKQDERVDATPILIEPTPTGCRQCKLLEYQRGEGMKCPRGKYATASTTIFESNVNPNQDCTHTEAKPHSSPVSAITN